MRFLALDFETSHTDAQLGAPVTLGVAAFEDGEVVGSYEWVCKPDTHYKTGAVTRCYDERARLIHGYTLEHLLEHGEPLDKVCLGLTEFAAKTGTSNATIVAYNSNFDQAFLNTMLYLGGSYDRITQAYRPYASPLSGPWQDAKALAERICPRLENYKLATVAPFLGVGEQGDVHGALKDALLAGKVFLSLRERMRGVVVGGDNSIKGVA